MRGVLTSQQKFLFPDSPMLNIPENVNVFAALNGRIGIQILAECGREGVEISAGGEVFSAEIFQMLDVPVECNTGTCVDQGGVMVIRPDRCPDDAIRRAPFRVYDCLKPASEGIIAPKDGRAAAYVSLSLKEGLPAGVYSVPIEIRAGAQRHVCTLRAAIYPVKFDERRFHQTLWFSLEQMQKKHEASEGSAAFYRVVREYARAMRRAHQDTFKLELNRENFQTMKPIIDLFLEEGFDTLETGGLLCRGRRPDGSADLYTAEFKCAAAPQVPADSDEGYPILCRQMKEFSAFIEENYPKMKILFHIIDEPDVYCRSEEDLQARRIQYFQAASIVRRYLPRAKIIEAVKTPSFRGGMDVMVPITDGYQSNQEAFDRAIAMGDEVWTYVCCCPEGHWLNRFLDRPLIHGRLLMWGCAANGLKGYLHWGFNQYGCTPDPFTATRGLNEGEMKSDFPCGDAFIVYPGEGGPWLSLRLEAERQGAEEAMLLSALREKDPKAHDLLIQQVFRRFDEYDDRPEKVDEAAEQLLIILSNTRLNA